MLYDAEIAFLTRQIAKREEASQESAKFLADFCEEMKERHGSVWPRLTIEAMGFDQRFAEFKRKYR